MYVIKITRDFHLGDCLQFESFFFITLEVKSDRFSGESSFER